VPLLDEVRQHGLVKRRWKHVDGLAEAAKARHEVAWDDEVADPQRGGV
jgi:hypothetical protein